MSEKITQQIIDCPVTTTIADIRKMMEKHSKESIVDRIKATTAELLLLQYRMREYAILEWYDSLSERQQKIHMFYEKHYEEFKKRAGNNNWVMLVDNIDTIENVSVSKFDDNVDMWICYVHDNDAVETIAATIGDIKHEGVMFCPMFSVST
mgnify:CR=1 FL=1